MRKITKARLDELRQSLPEVTGNEKAQCIGGDYYFMDGGSKDVFMYRSLFKW